MDPQRGRWTQTRALWGFSSNGARAPTGSRDSMRTGTNAQIGTGYWAVLGARAGTWAGTGEWTRAGAVAITRAV